MLPPLAREFTKQQIDQINKISKTGGRLVIKPTRKQIEGGFLVTLASIEFQGRLVWFQRFLALVYRLIKDHLVTQEMFMFQHNHPLHPHMVRVIHITHPPLLVLGKTQ